MKNIDYKKLEQKLAAKIRNRIMNRTLDGYDYLGQKFDPYTKQYADKKGVGVDDVNLVLSGSMMRNFYVDVKITDEPEEFFGDYLWFPGVEITYSFNHIEDGKGTTPLKKYLWNAQGFDGFYGRKDRAGLFKRHTPSRDFLGLDNDATLFDEVEINDMLNEILETM